MKLLLDENLSRRIVPALQNAYPGTTQIALVGLEQASDKAVWQFAQKNDFILVTKDVDFPALLSLYGPPPKIIFLAIGNCTNQNIIDALLQYRSNIYEALSHPEISLLELHR